MGQRTDIWTYLIITALAVMVWIWAAGETRVQEKFPGVAIRFSAGDAAAWSVETGVRSVTIVGEGSQWAISRAERDLREVVIDLPSEAGTRNLELTPLLRNHPSIRETGITVVSTSPSMAQVDVDRIEKMSVRVRPSLPRQTVGEVVVEPMEVTMSMPARLRQQLPDDLSVEAFIPRADLDSLQADVSHTIQNVPLRLPDPLPQSGAVTLEPKGVTLTFTIRSQIRETKVESPVRVQLAGPPEDLEYVVEFEPKQLRNVSVSAPAEIIERIESGEAVVVAMVHLRSSEKEARIAEKPVTYFMALWDDDGAEVIGTVNGSDDPPIIDITITDRPD